MICYGCRQSKALGACGSKHQHPCDEQLVYFGGSSMLPSRITGTMLEKSNHTRLVSSSAYSCVVYIWGIIVIVAMTCGGYWWHLLLFLLLLGYSC